MTLQLKHRQTVYITDPHFKQYKCGEFTGYLTENPTYQIAYVEVFDKSSRKQGHLETICVNAEYLSTVPPINLNF
ncbi:MULTISPECIES: hypothetical protein [Pseudanabaena]|uniref:Uncharacterized protein n=2 Tax=Pseudanabaena TaxID=1152 RepID=L8MZ87_9CYAN|nr:MULTISPECIES: hypothetical protein [Pseudanabaena]ELS32801.1 hypothetical protein Pse7429DRAFT_2006 [Pseudanabaena biceps PCC 7429]MDG3494989.1 hypothetical protein [Pseudanabaena catenata USMAC16]